MPGAPFGTSYFLKFPFCFTQFLSPLWAVFDLLRLRLGRRNLLRLIAAGKWAFVRLIPGLPALAL
jgi:hypothetical protein